MKSKEQKAIELVKRGYKLNVVAKESGIDSAELERLVAEDNKREFRNGIALDEKKIKEDAKKMDKLIESYYTKYNKSFRSTSRRYERNRDISEQINECDKKIQDMKTIFDTKLSAYLESRKKKGKNHTQSASNIKEQDKEKDPYTQLAKNIGAIKTIISKIDLKEVSEEQLRKLYELLSRPEAKKYAGKGVNLIEPRAKVVRSLLGFYEEEIRGSTSAERIREILSRITPEMEADNSIYVNNLRTNASRKVSELSRKAALDRFNNDIPDELDSIIRQIIDGTLDIESANSTIDKLARDRVQRGPKNKFSLDEKRQREQIIVKMRKAFENKADQYKVNDGESVIRILKSLDSNQEQAMRCVVKNLIEQGRYQDAKDICQRCMDDNRRGRFDDPTPVYIYANTLLKEVCAKEIGEIVLRAINARGTDEEKAIFYRTIKSGLKATRIKLSSVSLGKNRDGNANILLSDIMDDGIQL